jgi:CDP-diacylglycerol--glycerol-3-phosphate 3-phosphatidyltransferase
MNLPNKLTVSRFIMVPFFVLLLEVDDMALSPLWRLVGGLGALGLFLAASATDYYDGMLARKYGLTTNFGTLMDPLADKLIVVSAFVVFVGEGLIPAWMVIAILCREFLITGLRLLGTSQGRIIQADRWGKNKTISQMAVIITILALRVVRDALTLQGFWQDITFGGMSLDFWMWTLMYGLTAVAVFFTLVSGAFYLYNNWDLLRENGES